MPHLDEFLGVTTVAAAGLLAAVSLPSRVDHSPPARAETPTASAAMRPGDGEMVRLPSVDVIARRSGELGGVDGDGRLSRRRPTNDATQPKA